jgi:hypothetical protein
LGLGYLILLWAACGGGAGSEQQGASNSSNSSSISITISPSAAAVAPSQSRQLLATVGGTTNNGVVWAVNGVQGGSPATGTVSSGGLFLAPSTPSVGSVMVSATSVADTSISANATITLTVQDSITVNFALAAVVTGSTQQFTAAINSVGSSAVEWLVNGVAGGNATVGTISSSGVYTAPGAVPNSAITVTAVDASDSLASANAAVTIITPAALEAHEQWQAGVAEAAASYGCLDISVQQQSTESITDAINRFGLTASEGSCLVLWPISTDPGSIWYSLAWGGTIDAKDVLYISDVGQMRIWNGVPVAAN